MQGFIDAVAENLWFVWVGFALLLGIVEVATLDFTAAMFVVGALAAAGVSVAGGSFTLQAVTFSVVSLALLVVVRPYARTWLMRNAPVVPTGADALTGRAAVVLAEVTSRGGQVKLAGEVWSARTAHAGTVVSVGGDVRVVAIEGATAVVAPVRTAQATPTTEEEERP